MKYCVRVNVFIFLTTIVFSPWLMASERDVAAPQPEPGSLFLFPERIPLEDGSLAHAERGWMFVPVDRTRNDSDVLSVEIYRCPAKADVPEETPPIFRLMGGPGFPGLSPRLEKEGFYEEEIEPLTEIADLVVVGQRGIGSSKPDTICGRQEFPFV